MRRFFPTMVWSPCAGARLDGRVPPGRDRNSAEHGILMDAATGQVLWQKERLRAMPPASMSKLMTLELLFHG